MANKQPCRRCNSTLCDDPYAGPSRGYRADELVQCDDGYQKLLTDRLENAETERNALRAQVKRVRDFCTKMLSKPCDYPSDKFYDAALSDVLEKLDADEDGNG